jgi:peptidoglycan-associated lipoprotein
MGNKVKKELKNMKKIGIISCALFALFCTGCHQKSSDVWNDQNTSLKDNKGSSLWGSSEEISSIQSNELKGPSEEDFIPLREEDLQTAFTDGAIPQPKETPGEKGSSLPGIDHFSSVPGSLSAIFQTLYFNTDDHILRGKESLSAIDRIAHHLKANPHLYIFVEGHCDERGPEAYNLSLGARRANYVRSLLIQKGVDKEHIHTVSYGKEKPIAQGHNPEAWSKNRRAEFKLYKKP